MKSMMGEELNASIITERGLLGDRVYALVDQSTGRVASAKNPKKWGKLFDCRAAYIDPPKDAGGKSEVKITLPDGRTLTSNDSQAHGVLSEVFGTPVKLMAATLQKPCYEEYWPDVEGLARREAVTDEEMPSQTFFDAASIHLLTTTTLDTLRGLYPEGRFEARRFRPNIIVEPPSATSGFMENDWIGRTLLLGDDVRLKVIGACGRCVMTTLPQGDLPRDLGILRAAARYNKVKVGVYAEVEQGGTVKRGDPFQIQ